MLHRGLADCFGVGILANGAGVSHHTVFLTGSLFGFLALILVAESIVGDRLAGDFDGANGAVDDLVIAAGVNTSGRFYILLHGGSGSMPQRGNLSLCNSGLTADRALLTLGHAVFSAGSCCAGNSLFRVAQGSLDFGAASGACLCGGAGCRCAGGMVRLLQYSFTVVANLGVLAGDGCLILRRDAGASIRIGDTRGNPLAIGIGIDGAVSRVDLINGISGGAVCILQLCHNNGNIHRSSVSARLSQLVGNCFSTDLHTDHTGTGTGNDSTTGSGVQEAGIRIDSAVNLNLGVAQRGTGNAGKSARCIGQGSECLVVRTGITAPIVQVIDVDTLTVGQIAAGTLTDDDLSAGQEGQILGNIDLTADYLHRQVVGNRQHKLTGLDGYATHQTQFHADVDFFHGHVAINLINLTVFGFVVVLDQITGINGEEAVRSNEGNLRTLNANHTNRSAGVTLFHSTGVQYHGDFDILNVVLVHGEDLVAMVRGNGTGRRTATPVRNLESFIDSTGAKDFHLTGAHHVAPGIEVGTAVDGNLTALSHLDKANRTVHAAHNGAGTACVHGTGNADGTGHGDICTAGHVQRPVCSRRHIRSIILNGGGLRSQHRFRCVIGNQQGNTAGNGVVTCRQSAVGSQNDFGTSSGSCVQVVEQLIANLKVCFRTGIVESRLQCDILSRCKGIGVCGGQYRAIRAEPTQECIAGGRVSSQRHLGVLITQAVPNAGGSNSSLGGIAVHSNVVRSQIPELSINRAAFQNINAGGQRDSRIRGDLLFALVPAHKGISLGIGSRNQVIDRAGSLRLGNGGSLAVDSVAAVALRRGKFHCHIGADEFNGNGGITFIGIGIGNISANLFTVFIPSLQHITLCRKCSQGIGRTNGIGLVSRRFTIDGIAAVFGCAKGNRALDHNIGNGKGCRCFSTFISSLGSNDINRFTVRNRNGCTTGRFIRRCTIYLKIAIAGTLCPVKGNHN